MPDFLIRDTNEVFYWGLKLDLKEGFLIDVVHVCFY